MVELVRHHRRLTPALVKRLYDLHGASWTATRVRPQMRSAKRRPGTAKAFRAVDVVGECMYEHQHGAIRRRSGELPVVYGTSFVGDTGATGMRFGEAGQQATEGVCCARGAAVVQGEAARDRREASSSASRTWSLPKETSKSLDEALAQEECAV